MHSTEGQRLQGRETQVLKNETAKDRIPRGLLGSEPIPLLSFDRSPFCSSACYHRRISADPIFRQFDQFVILHREINSRRKNSKITNIV